MIFLFLFLIGYIYIYYKNIDIIKHNVDDSFFLKIRTLKKDEDYKLIRGFFFSLAFTMYFLILIYYIVAPIFLLFFKNKDENKTIFVIPRLFLILLTGFISIPFLLINIVFSFYAKHKVYKIEKNIYNKKEILSKYFINGTIKRYYKNKLHNEECCAIEINEEDFNIDLFFTDKKDSYYIRGKKINLSNVHYLNISKELSLKELQYKITDF
jgi:hypothetical protein